jgi:hypothetical protein
LYDAQRVDPEVSKAESLAELNGVLKAFGKLRKGNSLMVLSKVRGQGLEIRATVAPAVTQSRVLRACSSRFDQLDVSIDFGTQVEDPSGKC